MPLLQLERARAPGKGVAPCVRMRAPPQRWIGGFARGELRRWRGTGGNQTLRSRRQSARAHLFGGQVQVEPALLLAVQRLVVAARRHGELALEHLAQRLGARRDAVERRRGLQTKRNKVHKESWFALCGSKRAKSECSSRAAPCGRAAATLLLSPPPMGFRGPCGGDDEE